MLSGKVLSLGSVGLALGALTLFACGGDDEDEGGTNSPGGSQSLGVGEGPCDSPEVCAGNVCVALIDGNNPPVYCTQTCGSCPDGFYCDSSTFGLMGLSFCRFGSTPAETPEPPSEPPRLPCKSDDECPGNSVCATYKGVRDCTIVCSEESDCTPPSLGGITMDLMQCAADQTEGVTRNVCLPDPNCFPNPMSCISGPM